MERSRKREKNHKAAATVVGTEDARGQSESRRTNERLIFRMIYALVGAFVVAIVGYLLSSPSKDSTTLAKDSMVVFGFLPDYRYEAADVAFIIPKLTHLCLFSSEADQATGRVIARLPSKEKLQEIRRLANISGTKLFLALGGAGRSDFFPGILHNKARYKVFMQDLVKILNDNGFHGVEVNWMYPRDAKDLAALQNLLKDLKKQTMEVSFAIPPDTEFARAIGKLPIDMFHIMAYQTSIGGSHAVQTAKSVVEQISEHIPPERLTLGIPFYGTKTNNGEAISYEDYVRTSIKRGIVIEDQQVLRDKVKLAREENLLGISIWELGQDCRPNDVANHKKSCPDGEKDSLLSVFEQRL